MVIGDSCSPMVVRVFRTSISVPLRTGCTSTSANVTGCTTKRSTAIKLGIASS